MAMHDDDSEFEEAARLLRATRPEPRPDFVHKTEARLLGTSRTSGGRARRPLFAALGLTGALASGLIVAALVGGGPLAVDGNDVRAREDCRTLTVTTTQTNGELVALPDGTKTVVSRDRPVTIERCR